MVKKNISSLDLTAIVNELQFLVNGRITKVYQPEQKELVLQLHVPGKGKQLLRIFPGMFLNLTGTKESTLRPSGLSLQLRKYLDNAYLREIYQKDSERIVILVFEGKNPNAKEQEITKYHLIIELFSKGNLILTDKDWKIITSSTAQVWESRTVKVRETYQFPPESFNWKTATLKQIIEVIKKSDKKNLATCLAIELSFGGLYAEEVCKISDVDSKKEISEVTDQDIKQVFKGLRKVLELLEKPAGFVYEDNVLPLELTGQKSIKKLKSFNEALDTLNPLEKRSPYENKIKSIQGIINDQEKAITELEQSIELNTREGELIYEKYQNLQKLLEIVKELRKSKEWTEISKELKKEKKIKQVDLKNKKIMVDL
ncbi:MAG: NFACT family protein [archaeon]|nr:NFACT family protein [Nanoarchaeota archaeon]